jgi:hypothetical protein
LVGNQLHPRQRGRKRREEKRGEEGGTQGTGGREDGGARADQRALVGSRQDVSSV